MTNEPSKSGDSQRENAHKAPSSAGNLFINEAYGCSAFSFNFVWNILSCPGLLVPSQWLLDPTSLLGDHYLTTSITQNPAFSLSSDHHRRRSHPRRTLRNCQKPARGGVNIHIYSTFRTYNSLGGYQELPVLVSISAAFISLSGSCLGRSPPRSPFRPNHADTYIGNNVRIKKIDYRASDNSS